MAESFESGALLGHVYTLPGGLSVRLRLARSSDAPAVRQLLQSQDQEGSEGQNQDRAGSELETARLVHFDPRRRYVLCATGLVDGAETLLGVGSISLDGASEPELLVVAPDQPGELARLLRGTLVSCAQSRAKAA